MFRNRNAAVNYEDTLTDISQAGNVNYTPPVDNLTLSGRPDVDPAVPQPVVGWLGPVLPQPKTDHKIQFQWGRPAPVQNGRLAENTLLFTDRQIIAVRLTDADADGIPPSAVAAVFDPRLHPEHLSNYDRQRLQTAESESLSLHFRYYKTWEALMQRLLEYHSLADVVARHDCSAIPYNQIGSVQVTQGRVNPGLDLHLQYGQTVHFSTERIDLLPWAAQVLSSYVAVTN